jgi:hypothetical protein
MGKFPTSLLSIVFQLYLVETIFADEQVRRVQEELRKRHLFYGETTGEITRPLTVAIGVYQGKKGFPRTGRLDAETLASLGLLKAPVKTTQLEIPFVSVGSGDFRGPNGEALPAAPVVYRSNDGPVAELNGAAADAAEVAVTTAGDDPIALSKDRRAATAHSRARPRRSQPQKMTNPFVRAFNTVDHAIRQLVGDPQPRKKRAVAARL